LIDKYSVFEDFIISDLSGNVHYIRGGIMFDKQKPISIVYESNSFNPILVQQAMAFLKEKTNCTIFQVRKKGDEQTSLVNFDSNY
jgi:hypothetical protein